MPHIHHCVGAAEIALAEVRAALASAAVDTVQAALAGGLAAEGTFSRSSVLMELLAGADERTAAVVSNYMSCLLDFKATWQSRAHSEPTRQPIQSLQGSIAAFSSKDI